MIKKVQGQDFLEESILAYQRAGLYALKNNVMTFLRYILIYVSLF